MKLTIYKVFRDRVRALPEIVALGSVPEIFRFHEDNWLDDLNQTVEDKVLVAFLYETQLKRLKFHRPGRQKLCFFWIESMNSVVVIKFTIFLKNNKLSTIAGLIGNCYINSKNEFDATHDALTLLPNRKHFEETLNKCVADIISIDSTESASVLISNSEGLTLLAFDLDHFKQINDTFGHPYGDIVLAAFAWRLEDFANEVERSRPFKAFPARLGGEEFQLLIIGLGSDIEGQTLANEFRQKVNKSSLPSEYQWSKLSQSRGVPSERLPTDAERIVSVSIGHALLTVTEARTLSATLGSKVIPPIDQRPEK